MNIRPRWRRIAAVAVLATGVLVGIVLAPLALDAYDARRERAAAEPHPIAASDAQQIDIVRTLLASDQANGVPPPPPPPGHAGSPAPRRSYPLLVNSTLALRPCPHDVAQDESASCSLREVVAREIETDEERFREVPRKFRQELVLANGVSTTMPDPRLAGLGLASRDDAYAPLARYQAGWREFHAAFPASNGILEVSRVVLAADGKQALVVAEIRCGWLCGSGTLFLLERRSTEWSIARSWGLWVK